VSQARQVARGDGQHAPQALGIKISNGTIADAMNFSAPGWTKKHDRELDPEPHQTAEIQQRYLGMKAHVAVDSRSKLLHTVLVSAANLADRDAVPYLMHGRETQVWGDLDLPGVD
jgi:IS5 family transposase